MSKFQSIFLNQQITCKNNYLNNKKWKIRISLEAWLKWQGIKVGMGRLSVRVLVGTRELLKEKRMRTQSSGNSGVVEMQMLYAGQVLSPQPPISWQSSSSNYIPFQKVPTLQIISLQSLKNHL